MRTRLLALFAGFGVVLTITPVEVHHSFAAEYDPSAPIQLRGNIAKMDWINPHSWIHLDVKRPDGTVERWEIEAGPPSGLIRRGFTKESVPTGIEVQIQGYRARDGSRQANAQFITLPDGRNLFAGSPGSPGAEKQPPQK